MALKDALAAEAAKKPGPRCTVCLLSASLPKADRDALTAALDNLAITSAAISRALLSEGHTVRSETIRRHRARECSGL